MLKRKTLLKRLGISFILGSSIVLVGCHDEVQHSFLCEADRLMAEYTETTDPNTTSETASSGLVYALKDDGDTHTATVRLGSCTASSITIPSTYVSASHNNIEYSVIGVAESGFTHSDLAGTSSQSDPYYLPNITSITLPSTITLLGSQAFKATAITSIAIPSGVTELSPSCFMDCQELTKVTFDTVNNGRIEKVGDSCFLRCLHLVDIDLPEAPTNKTTTIGESAFQGCSSLVRFLLPSSIDKLGQFAFANDAAVKMFLIPSTITSIGDYAFKGCSSATIYFTGAIPSCLPTTNNNNGDWNYLQYVNSKTYVSFESNKGSVDYSNGFYYFKAETATGSGIYNLTIFKYDGNAGDLVIPTTLPDDDSHANYRVVAIDSNAFKGNTNLTGLSFEAGTKTRPQYLATIGESAFENCKNIKKLDFKNATALTEIKNSAFHLANPATLGSSTSTLEFPASLITIGDSAFMGLSGITNMIFDGISDNNAHLKTIGNAAFRPDGNMNNFPTGGATCDLVFPNTLTKIDEAAFAWQRFIKTITFTDNSDTSVQCTLNTYAFSRVSFCQKVTLSKNITTIGTKAFEFITNDDSSSDISKDDRATVHSIFIPKEATSITSNAFDYDRRLTVYRECLETDATNNNKTLSLGHTNSSKFDNSTPDIPQYWNCSRTPISVTSDTTTDTNIVLSETQANIIEYRNGNNNFDFVQQLDNDNKLTTNLTLSRYIYDAKTTDTAPVVPSTITINSKKYTVTKIGDAAFQYSSNTGTNAATTCLTSVTLPSTITEIGAFAFADSSSLTNVKGTTDCTLPDNVAKVGRYCFTNTAIASMTFGSSLTSFGEGDYSPFGVCPDLKNVYIDSDNDNYVADTSGKGVYVKSGTNTKFIYSPYALEDTSYTLRTDCTETGLSAYSLSSKLVTLNLVAKLLRIGKKSFYNDTALTTVQAKTGDTLAYTYIGQNAFENCTSLNSFAFSNALTQIDYAAFRNDTSLASKDSLDFSSTNLSTIGESAFENCTSFTGLNYPNSLTSFGKKSFYGDTALKTVTKPITGTQALATIGESAFEGCTAMTSFDFPSSLTSIGASAFKSDVALTGGVLSSTSLTSIGTSAFESSGLTSISLPDTFTGTVGDSAFKSCKATSLALNKAKATGTGSFASCTGLTSLTLPTSLTTIGSSSFLDCSNVTSISIQSTSAMNISNKAFSGCSRVNSFSFADVNSTSQIKINRASFKGMTSLTSLVLPVGVKFSDLTIANDDLPFSGDSGLTLYLKDTGATFDKEKSTNYPDGWNYSAYDNTTGATELPFAFYSGVQNPTVAQGGSSISGAKYWRYVDGVPTIWGTA